MERYFNTFKNELIYLFYFKNDDLLNRAVYDYVYSWYNHLRSPSTKDKLLLKLGTAHKNIRQKCYNFN
ncbi:IS3 family transposase [Lutibacter sp. B2]|nr:IS3 family transposase [Lutibacter sp. B2]